MTASPRRARDLGAGVSTALGLRHSEHLIGVHLNYIQAAYKPYLAPGTEITAAERQFQAARRPNGMTKTVLTPHLQGTRPQTPAYALNDSPLAWRLGSLRSFGSGPIVEGISTAAFREMLSWQMSRFTG